MDAINVARLRNTLSPTPIVLSLWASYKTLWDTSITKIRKALDMKPLDKRFPPGFAFLQLENAENERDNNRAASSENGNQETKQTANQWSKLLPPLPQPGPDYANASRAFKKTLAKKWNRTVDLELPRGTILMSGLLELNGPKAICVLEVKAAYEVRASQWLAVGVGIRREQPRRQTPVVRR